MRSARFTRTSLTAAVCALALLSAGAGAAHAAGDGGGATPQVKDVRTSTAPSPDGNPASKAAQVAGVCDDAVPIGTTGYIKRGGATIASVKQFYSKECQENYGYVWVWQSFRANAAPYDVTGGVYSYDDDTVHGKNGWKATTQQEFWSAPADTVTHCTSGVGTLRPAGAPQPSQAYSERRC
ncbi:hypothetical protein [Streptomyces sp. NPDC002851]